MKDILKNEFVDYLNSTKPLLTPPIDKTVLTVRSEVTSDAYFDIIDRQATILVATGNGSASYKNVAKKRIEIIDYEDFINQLPAAHQKKVKRPDFIVYHIDGDSFFILNELSQSASTKNKRNDAKLQLHNALLLLSRAAKSADFMSQFKNKVCVFANKERLIGVSNDAVKAFRAIEGYLPDPIAIKFQPITALGFKAIETAVVEIEGLDAL